MNGHAWAAALLLLVGAPPAVAGQPFQHEAAGSLLPNSGRGAADPTLYAPSMRFPVERPPAYANSQVYMTGGSNGPPGSWANPVNYRYPWRDNFCERRSRRTPSCPSGVGHQGQDIRGADRRDDLYWAVAAESGRISNVGVYSVELTGDSGTRYRYLHLSMNKLRVRQNARVAAGDRIGLVSNDFGGIPTPVHLHFEILQNVGAQGLRHVPPYASLVQAYQRLLAAP